MPNNKILSNRQLDQLLANIEDAIIPDLVELTKSESDRKLLGLETTSEDDSFLTILKKCSDLNLVF